MSSRVEALAPGAHQPQVIFIHKHIKLNNLFKELSKNATNGTLSFWINHKTAMPEPYHTFKTLCNPGSMRLMCGLKVHFGYFSALPIFGAEEFFG